MKSGGKQTNKAIEFLYRLSLEDDFQNDIKKIRISLGIPPDGYAAPEDRSAGVRRSDSMVFFASMMSLMKKCEIPQAYWCALQHYLEMNNFEIREKPIDLIGFIDRWVHRDDDKNAPSENWFKYKKEPFVKIILFGNNSKSDVHAFIDKNWWLIEEILLEQGSEFKRVRGKKDENRPRDSLIIKLAKESREHLITGLKQKPLNPKSKYKNTLIRLRIEELGYNVSDESIGKIIFKYKNKK